MLQKDTSKKHLNLIRRVARVDKEAAKYIKQRLKDYIYGEEGYSTADSLSGSFIFSDTPQGGDYWYRLMKAIKEI